MLCLRLRAQSSANSSHLHRVRSCEAFAWPRCTDRLQIEAARCRHGAQARLRADSEQLLRAQASSSAAAHWPPRPPSRRPPNRSTSSSSTEAFRPAGAASSTTTSRASPCTCTRRRAPSRGAGRSRATCSSRRICRRRTRRSRRSRISCRRRRKWWRGGGRRGGARAADGRRRSARERPPAAPRQPPLAGVFQHEPEDDGFGSYRDVQLRFLRHYTSACLGAHADISEAPATWTKWERPPVELTCVVLGVTVARTTRRRASAVAWSPKTR